MHFPDDQDNDVIIVSYPRSGLNWLRYCIEFFSGVRTPGKPLIVEQGKTIISRTHDVRGNTRNGSPDCWRTLYAAQGLPFFKKVILLLRDFRECYLGEVSSDLDLLETYTENINAYDAFSGKKMVVYYEDMIDDFSEVSRILDFIGIPHNPQTFDLKFHQRKSLLIYHRRRFSHTRNNLRDYHFHARNASEDIVLQIETRIQSFLGKELCGRYLHRYFNEAQDIAEG